MKKSTKAALFSGLIFPGTGLFLLKHYVRGSIFFIPALLALIYVCSGVSAAMDEVSKKISANPNMLYDIAGLVGNVQASISSHIPLYHQAISLFAFAWIISTISSYFAGKKQELEDKQITVAE